jgi:hypothetical protein
MTEHIFNGCRTEVMLSRENAFQLDSWDNAFAMRSADYLQATSKVTPKRQTEVVRAWLWSVCSGWVRGLAVTDCWSPEDGG